MVFNSNLVVSVANKSAETWQNILYTPNERITTPQLLHLICCLPLQHFGRLALCLCSFICFPPPDSYLTYYDSDSDSDSYDYGNAHPDDDDDDRSFQYDSHSD